MCLVYRDEVRTAFDPVIYAHFDAVNLRVGIHPATSDTRLRYLSRFPVLLRLQGRGIEDEFYFAGNRDARDIERHIVVSVQRDDVPIFVADGWHNEVQVGVGHR